MQQLDHVRDGDLVAIRGNTWLGKLIRWATDSEYSHVGLVVWVDIAGLGRRPCLLEAAISAGVRVLPLALCLKEVEEEKGAAWLFPRKADGKAGEAGEASKGEASVIAGIRRWGKPYPPLYQLLLTGYAWLRWLFRVTDVSLDSYHCAEFVAASLMDADIAIPRAPVLMTPRDITELPLWGERKAL